MNTPQITNNDADASDNAASGESETIARLRAEVGELRLRSAREGMIRHLRSAGARSPELLLTALSGKFEYGEDGSVANAADLVEALMIELPEQFGPAQPFSIDAGSGATAAARPLTKAALAKMSPEQISRLDWAAVRQVLSRA